MIFHWSHLREPWLPGAKLVHLEMELRDPFADFPFKSIDLDVPIFHEHHLSNLLVVATELLLFRG